jgi:RHS repeat-associated protein
VSSGSKVIAEYAAGALVTVPTREYIYSGSQLLATIEGTTTKYHHADHLSMRVSTDSSGVAVAQSGHFPYGENWYESGGTNKLKFTSYERDAGTNESGNDYAMMRYHISRLGRFSSPDPLAGSVSDPQSLNRYTYVRNNPLNAVDPTGLNEADGWIGCSPSQLNCGGWSWYGHGGGGGQGGGGGGGGTTWDGNLMRGGFGPAANQDFA